MILTINFMLLVCVFFLYYAFYRILERTLSTHKSLLQSSSLLRQRRLTHLVFPASRDGTIFSPA